MSDKYDNSGVLFKNDKGDNPKRPDFRGSLMVGGVDHNISAWIRESRKSGKKFLSLQVEEKAAESKGGRNDGPGKVTEPKPRTTNVENWSDFDDF